MLISVFDEFGCATYVPEGGFFLNDRLLGFSTIGVRLTGTTPVSTSAFAFGKCV